MSDIRSYEPLWGVWKTTELIGQGSFGTVWRAERTDARGFYSAIKHVALPGSEAEIQSLYDEGIVRDERAVDAYYEAMRESLLNEIRFMYVFRDDPNIVTYEDHIAFRHEDAPGYDVFIRMELLKSLGVITRGMDFTPEQACGLGIDICTALVALKRENVIHRDIKPANILVNDKGVCKLADFGVARRMEKTSMVMSKKGTYAYMSPEVYKGEAAGETADLYSLGLVMHRLLNANRAPFLPLTGNVGVDAAEASVARRMNGEEVPYPAYAPPALGRAICKACAYDPKARFASPEEFRAALERCLYAPEETVAVVVPPAYKPAPAAPPVPEAKAAEPVARVPAASPAKVQQPPVPVPQPQAQMASPALADAPGLPYYLQPGVRVEPAKKKKGGKVVAILFGITAALAAAAFLTLYILAFSKYNEATALAGKGRYEEAYDLFDKLGSYKDSAQQAQIMNKLLEPQAEKYEEADALYKEGKYSKAYELFSYLGDFRDSDKKAKECADYMYTIDHIAFQYKNDGTYKIALYTGDHSEVHVPSIINGYLVTVICADTFRYCSNLENVYIPDSVTVIGENAIPAGTVIIHCSEGSYVQQYAIDHGISYVTDGNS